MKRVYSRKYFHNEVESLYSRAFPGYSLTSEDVLRNIPLTLVDEFQSLFGFSNVDGEYLFSYGLYMDEDDIWRFMGPVRWSTSANLFTPEYFGSYQGAADNGSYRMGTYLVRSSVVPVPAAVWLFGSALAGLGWMRRARTAAREY